VHDKCDIWAQKTGMSFAPEKYELIHFSKKRRQRPVPEAFYLRMRNAVITPNTRVKILGIWLDEKLNWREHIKEVKSKTKNQIRALTAVTALTWGASFTKAR
jgi:hypothetical protein